MPPAFAYSMWDTFKKLSDLLDRREQLRALVVFGMMVVTAVLDTAGIASIMPFVAVMADPDIVESNQYLAAAYHFFGFQSTHEVLIFLGLVAFALVVGSTAFKALSAWAMLRFTSMRNYSFSRRLFDGYLHRPYEWFLDRHSNDLKKTVLSEVNLVTGGALTPALQLVAQCVVVLFIVALLLIVDVYLALTVTVFLGGAFMLVYWRTRHYLTRIGEERVRANRDRSRVCGEALAGVKDVKIFGLEESVLRSFEKPSLRFIRHQTTSAMLGQLPQYAFQAIAFGGALLIVEYQLLLYGSLGQVLPMIALYILAGSRLLPAFQKIYQSSSTLRFTKPALDAMHRELKETIKPRAAGPATLGGVILPRANYCLELRGISYRYPGARAPTLNEITMTLPPHSMVGLVGHTGAGKTTLVDVILGLLRPEKGELLVSGTPITEANCRVWQRCIGYVPQHTFLADDSIKANIAFGIHDSQIDMAAVERAARIANLHDFVINQLAHGYDTSIGERGVRLSGGERQRIGIARALYHDPDLLIMDEATNALDNIVEREVMDAVENLEHRKMIILIAHRLSTVRLCDIIFLLERGRVIDSGSYEDLLGNNVHFREMVENGLPH